MTKYAAHLPNALSTPQTEEVEGLGQVQNAAGGFVFDAGSWAHFQRFLILGTEGGTFYVAEKELTLAALKATKACIPEDGARAVALIASTSHAGRANKN